MVYRVKLNDGALDWLMQLKGFKYDLQLARFIDISPTTVSQLRYNKRKVPNSFIVGVYRAYDLGLDSPIYHHIKDK